MAAYNNGLLHGAWIDAAQSAEDLQAEIWKILAASPIRNAEEWAIHDYEGFAGIKLSECESLENVAAWADVLENTSYSADLISEVWALQNINNPGDLIDWMDDHYQGEYEDLADYGERWLEETGSLEKIDKSFRYYIDFERWAKDCEMNGEIMTVCLGHKELHVFWNHQ